MNAMKSTHQKTVLTTNPTLAFSPTAWAKLRYLRDRGDTEVGGFGIARHDDLLRVEDFQLVEQFASPVTVELSDEAVANFFEEQVDAGRQPAEFARVWIHSHPGATALPSSVDEATFARVFGNSDFAVMFILAREGETYARLQFNVGPRAAVELDVEIDFDEPFAGSDHAAWEEEYLRCVRRRAIVLPPWNDELRWTDIDPAAETARDPWHSYSDEDFWEMFAHERT
jgi:proteasome lid subunit RPN8/RPN11